MSITRNIHPEASTSGFHHSPGSPPLGDVLGILPVHSHGKKNGLQVGCVFCRFFCIRPCCLPGCYDMSTCPMMASSGFELSPGSPPSGDAWGILLVHQFGHQNRSDGGAFVHCQWFHHQPNHSILTIFWCHGTKKRRWQRTPHNPHPHCCGTHKNKIFLSLLLSVSSSFEHGLYKANCTLLNGRESTTQEISNYYGST